MERPRALRRGDAVAIVAPSSPFDRAVFERGLARLQARYQPLFDPSIFSSARYLAGDEQRRLSELNSAFANPAVRAVFCARGGYGAMHLLPGLALPRPAKILTGFSDVTALHLALQAKGVASLHSPVLTQLGSQSDAVADALFRALEEPGHRVALQGEPLVAGRVTGRVVGGNLSVLTRLLGTPYLPDLTGAILFFEEVTERPYRLDRMWTHLKLAGVFGKIAGVAMGTFTSCEEKDADYTALQLLAELARREGLPAIRELPVGHGEVNLPLPLGLRATLDGGAGTLTFEEGFVQ